MELLVESGITPQAKLAELLKEGDELVAIIVSALKTTRQSQPAPAANRA
jgi:hypothetical protein